MITLENKRLADWLTQRDELVSQGRKVSQKIEEVEIKIKRFEEREKKLTAKVIPPKELVEKGEELVKKVNEMSKELGIIADQINQSKLDVVPKKMKDDHQQLFRDREALEKERNKIFLKAQKIKDRIIPLVQKEVKPLIGQERMETIDVGRFDDIETSKIVDGKVTIETYNRLHDFMLKF
jgi:hypothetical protein